MSRLKSLKEHVKNNLNQSNPICTVHYKYLYSPGTGNGTICSVCGEPGRIAAGFPQSSSEDDRRKIQSMYEAWQCKDCALDNWPTFQATEELLDESIKIIAQKNK